MEITPSKPGSRTPVILVTGLDRDAIDRVSGAVAEAIAARGSGETAIVAHDLSRVADGEVIRTLRSGGYFARTRVELEHACGSCTVRADLLPLLRQLHRRADIGAVVVALDPVLEPEAVTWAIDNVVVDGMPGYVRAPAAHEVRVALTVACVAEMDWLEAATGDITMDEAGLIIGVGNDERTLAQVAVGQVEFADALVLAGCDAVARDSWLTARTAAVLKRLAPAAPLIMEIPQRPFTPAIAATMLSAIPEHTPHGRIANPFDSLLRGRPPLHEDCGVVLFEFSAQRPFHPGRLHEAIDELLEGVVRARGRLWLATQPDRALWLESAGGGLRVDADGRWLAAMDDDELADADPEHRAMAALRWDDEYGDRHSSIVILAHRADPDHIRAALRRACLTDDEMTQGQILWMAYDDPFGLEHVDPCPDGAGIPDQADSESITPKGQQ
ncbi:MULTISPECIES: ribosome hibernation factor-recruiting GTPase MRF [Gordonia]|jgi:G3E family GTPase|uniref:Cobalamin biosynthesis protein CobW n=1 Tax=Gordonia pseudamarae TaxID=2831662 RepID=A0ABX6IF83_9ACTN|nr:GTP-binding protein [Gordonia sp. (in: high G+C Gram-positive bacteria)]MBD0023397.1 GTP-binding protein [Gordonia sp. (in: high G+C Gram-positive bacteria)]QHN34500.1 cobalamin biosynthesis protein CobW [Gordonia pseudamarae]